MVRMLGVEVRATPSSGSGGSRKRWAVSWTSVASPRWKSSASSANADPSARKRASNTRTSCAAKSRTTTRPSGARRTYRTWLKLAGPSNLPMVPHGCRAPCVHLGRKGGARRPSTPMGEAHAGRPMAGIPTPRQREPPRVSRTDTKPVRCPPRNAGGPSRSPQRLPGEQMELHPDAGPVRRGQECRRTVRTSRSPRYPRARRMAASWRSAPPPRGKAAQPALSGRKPRPTLQCVVTSSSFVPMRTRRRGWRSVSSTVEKRPVCLHAEASDAKGGRDSHGGRRSRAPSRPRPPGPARVGALGTPCLRYSGSTAPRMHSGWPGRRQEGERDQGERHHPQEGRADGGDPTPPASARRRGARSPHGRVPEPPPRRCGSRARTPAPPPPP